MQQTQPLSSSTVRSSTRRSRWWSIPISPSSFTITAVSPMPGWPSRREISVVLPLPRKPVTSATGSLAVSCQALRRGRGRAGRAARPASRSASAQSDAEVVDDGRPALAVAQDVDASAPVVERAARSARAPGSASATRKTRARAPAILLGPVLVQEHTAESAHVVALYHQQSSHRRRRNGQGDLLLRTASTSTRSPAGSAPTAARTRRTTSRAACSPARSARRACSSCSTRYGLKTTWFIPGHSIETFPEETKLVVEAGHEIGMHGYSHENPISMTPEQEEAVLDQVHRPDRGGLAAAGRPATSRRGGSSRTSPTSCCSSTASSTTTA